MRHFVCSSLTALTAAVFILPNIAMADGETSADSAVGLEEIVITAEKRPEDLQHAPITETVVSGDEVRRASVTEMNELQTLVPNLNIQQAGPFSQYYIRGVGGFVTGANNQPGVGLNIDGVYSQSPTVGHLSMFDISGIEVLTGPQGTLFGRNSTAGAINITTHKPTFQDAAEIGLDIGDYGKINTDGMLNVALSDQWAVRAAFQTSRETGYYQDGFDDEANAAGRVRALYQPNEDLSLVLTADYAKEGGKGVGSIPYDPATGRSLNSNPWAGPTTPEVLGLVAHPDPFVPVFGFPTGDYGEYAQQDNVSSGANADLQWKLGTATFSALAGYVYSKGDSVAYLDGFAIAPDTISREKSLELRLASNQNDARLKWMLGLYYYGQQIGGSQLTVLGSAGSPLQYGGFGGFNTRELLLGTLTDDIANSTNNFAAFTQETVSLTDTVRLTAGLRLLHEEQRNQSDTYSFNPGPPAPPAFFSGEISWNKATWKVGAEVDLATNSLLYAAVATGWKAGGVLQYDAPYNQFLPETLTAYTLGSKNRFLEDRLQLNGEIFYWDYRNRQAQAFADSTVGGVTGDNLLELNAAKTHIEGADVAIAYKLTVNDLLALNAEYIASAVSDNYVLPSSTPLGSGCPQVQAGTATTSPVYNCSGTDLPQEPRLTGILSYQHVFSLVNGDHLTFDFRGKFQTTTDLTQSPTSSAAVQNAFTSSNAGLAYLFDNSRWMLRGYVNNLEDRIVRTAALTSPTTGTPWATLLPPRTYGLQVRTTF
jgi:iron complex outermembrane recepter protein